MLKLAVVTCSDTRGAATDTAGAYLEKAIQEAGWECVDRSIVKDEAEYIQTAIIHAADNLGADVVLTCGGTGLSPRDVTPEATLAVCDREVPGIAEGLRAMSLAITPHAMISRARAAQRGSTLVINFPGSEKAARESWEMVSPIFEHAKKMMAGEGH